MAQAVKKLSARAVVTITEPGRHSDGEGLYLNVRRQWARVPGCSCGSRPASGVPGQRAGKSLSATAMEMLLRRMDQDEVTLHGFRSAFRDWAGNETHFRREVAEAALAHVVGDNAGQAYQRGDALEKRRDFMQAWANHCAPTPGNVVNLRESGRVSASTG